MIPHLGSVIHMDTMSQISYLLSQNISASEEVPGEINNLYKSELGFPNHNLNLNITDNYDPITSCVKSQCVQHEALP